jgi:hypothetical protein
MAVEDRNCFIGKTIDNQLYTILQKMVEKGYAEDIPSRECFNELTLDSQLYLVYAALKRELWTPTQLTSAVWLDAADAATITLNGSNVSQWNDKSGNNRNASQSTASWQPLFVPTGMNGLPTLQTDGGDFLSIGLRFGLFQNVSGATIAIVIKYSFGAYVTNALSAFVSTGASPTTTRFGLTPSSTLNSLATAGRRLDTDSFAVAESSTTRISASGVGIIEVGNADYANARANHFTNGTQDATNVIFQTAGNTDNTTAQAASLFAINSFGLIANQLPSGCQISEVLMFNSTLSTTDRQKLEGYLAWKWGTVASLPAGHPYKNSPPKI